MLEALEAERLKFARHRATWVLVWGYPIGMVLLWAVVMAFELARGGPALPEAPESAASWIADTAIVWGAPGSTFGRYLIAAYTAVVFAGEYGWNTWKLVTPHRARWVLMAAKYVVVATLLYLAFALTGAITVVLSFAGDALTGEVTPKGLTAEALLRAQGTGALVALAPVLLTMAYTSLAAVVTRSALAAMLVGVVVATVDQVFSRFAPMLSVLAPDLVWALFHALPGYHLENLKTWIESGTALPVSFPEGAKVALSWRKSLAAISAWTAGLAALTVGAFQRQDLN